MCFIDLRLGIYAAPACVDRYGDMIEAAVVLMSNWLMKVEQSSLNTVIACYEHSGLELFHL